MAKILINTVENSKVVNSRVVSTHDVEYLKMSDSLSYFNIKTIGGETIPLTIVDNDIIDDAISAIERIYKNDNVLVRVTMYVFEGSTHVDSIN